MATLLFTWAHAVRFTFGRLVIGSWLSRTLLLGLPLTLGTIVVVAYRWVPSSSTAEGAWRSAGSLHGHEAAVLAVAITADGRTAASGAANGEVILWDINEKREMVCLREHLEPVHALAFAPDGRLLASGGHDHTVRLWDTKTGTAAGGTGSCFAEMSSGVESLAFSPDGRTLAVGESIGKVTLWDIEGPTDHVMRVLLWDVQVEGVGLRLRSVLNTSHQFVQALAFAPDGMTLATTGLDRRVQLWEVKTGQEVRTLEGHQGRVSGLAFAAGSGALASGAWDGVVRLWDAHNGTEMAHWKAEQGLLLSLALSADGRTVATGGADGIVRLWDTTGELRVALEGHGDWVTGLAFSRDGRTLISAGGADRGLRIWERQAS
jgi:WD40 repeat protein